MPSSSRKITKNLWRHRRGDSRVQRAIRGRFYDWRSPDWCRCMYMFCRWCYPYAYLPDRWCYTHNRTVVFRYTLFPLHGHKHSQHMRRCRMKTAGASPRPTVWFQIVLCIESGEHRTSLSKALLAHFDMIFNQDTELSPVFFVTRRGRCLSSSRKITYRSIREPSPVFSGDRKDREPSPVFS